MNEETGIPVKRIERLSVPTVRTSARRELSGEQLDTLRRVAGALIPASGERVGADQLGSFDAQVSEALAIMDPHLEAIEEALDLLAGVGPSEMFDALRRLDGEAQHLFYPLSLLVVGVYVYAPEVEAVTQYPHPHRNPAGVSEAADEIESGILDPVLERGEVFVPAPEGGATGTHPQISVAEQVSEQLNESRAENMIFSGIASAMITPFSADGRSVDEAELRAIVEQGVVDGLAGLVPCGGTGEFAAMSDEERRFVVGTTVDQVAGRTKVIAQVGSTSTWNAIEHARHAEAVGADALMVATPYYEPIDKAGVFRYLTAVAESVDLPIIVYNFPPAMRITWDREALTEIKAAIPSVQMVKDSSGNFAGLTSLITRPVEGVSVCEGEDVLLAPALLSGAVGAITGGPNFMAPALVGIHRAVAEGDADRVWEIWKQIIPLIEAVAMSSSYTGAVKTLCGNLGFEVGPVRAPYGEITDEQRSRLLSVLAEIDPSLLSQRAR